VIFITVIKIKNICCKYFALLINTKLILSNFELGTHPANSIENDSGVDNVLPTPVLSHQSKFTLR
jgi:hypothetical protein